MGPDGAHLTLRRISKSLICLWTGGSLTRYVLPHHQSMGDPLNVISQHHFILLFFEQKESKSVIITSSSDYLYYLHDDFGCHSVVLLLP